MLDGPIVLLALATCAGVAVSAMPAVSAGRALGIVLGLVVYYALVNASPAFQLKAASGLTVAGVVFGVAGVLGTDWSIAPALSAGWPAGVYDRLETLRRAVSVDALVRAMDLGNPREVGGSIALVLPAAVIRLWYGLRSSRRDPLGLTVASAATGAMSVVLLLSQSVSAIAGVVVALWLSAVVADRARRRWWLAAGLLCIAAGLVAAWPRLDGLALLRDSTATPVQPAPGVEHAAFGVAARLELWPRALQMLHDTPYTGAGLGTFAWVMDRFYPGFILGPERHAHNFFLHVGVDLGLPGLVAVVWLVAAFTWHVRATLRYHPEPATRVNSLAAGASLLAFLVFGTIDVVPLGAVPAVALWVVVGLGAAPRVPPAGERPAGRRHRALHRAMVVLLAMTLLAPVAWNGHFLNAGRVLAYRVLLAPAGTSHEDLALQRAGVYLRRAAQDGPQHSRTWYLLGIVAAERGAPDEALAALRRGVFADSDSPRWRYALGEALFGTAQGTDWPALRRIYRQWTTRYPRRAEWYVAAAIGACEGEGDRQSALAWLAQGRAAGAEPQMLLSAYHSSIVDRAPC